MTTHQYTPILSATIIVDTDSVKRNFVWHKIIEQNHDSTMINNSSSSYHIDPDNTPNVVLEIKNLGFGPAINLNTYLRKLVSVDGLNHLDESLTKKVEDFYDKIHLGNYVYYDYEDETELNEDWQIFPTFNLGVSEGNNYIYLAFSFVNINEPIYSIIEYSCAIRPALSPYPGTNPVTSGQDSCHIRPRFLRHSATVPALSGQ